MMSDSSSKFEKNWGKNCGKKLWEKLQVEGKVISKLNGGVESEIFVKQGDLERK
jgi:hypothetical protein